MSRDADVGRSMKVRRTATVVALAGLLFSAAVVLRGETTTALFDAADDAWRRGDYVAALNGFLALLDRPDGASFLERVALITGELYQTRELTPDGRAPRFSPDGRMIVYETGLETSRATRIVRNDAQPQLVADLPGISATFAPGGGTVAYLRIDENADLARAAKAIESAALTAQNRGALTQALARLIARDATIAIRDLGSGRETSVPLPPMLKGSLTY